MHRALKLALPVILLGISPVVAGELYPSIKAYHGKYAYEEVNGWRFFDDPQRIALIEEASNDAELIALVQSDAVVTSPIEVDPDSLRAIYWACEPKNCGSHNWSLVIDRIGGKAAICHFDDDAGLHGVWHIGHQTSVSDMQCPFALAEVPADVTDALAPKFEDN